MQKNMKILAIFLGGPMGPIHLVGVPLLLFATHSDLVGMLEMFVLRIPVDFQPWSSPEACTPMKPWVWANGPGWGAAALSAQPFATLSSILVRLLRCHRC